MVRMIFLSLVLVAGGWLQAGCIGNGPNPMETPGDHLAAGVDGVTSVVLGIPLAVLFGIYVLEQRATAVIRSDGGSGYCRDGTPVDPALRAPPEPVAGEASGERGEPCDPPQPLPPLLPQETTAGQGCG